MLVRHLDAHVYNKMRQSLKKKKELSQQCYITTVRRQGLYPKLSRWAIVFQDIFPQELISTCINIYTNWKDFRRLCQFISILHHPLDSKFSACSVLILNSEKLEKNRKLKGERVTWMVAKHPEHSVMRKAAAEFNCDQLNSNRGLL